MHDRLRLMLQPLDQEAPLYEVEAAPQAETISLDHAGVKASCRISPELPRLGPAPDAAVQSMSDTR
jgi:hypothetical protein